eukprot:scaffold45508_cov20-Tisochrysis_lutea.AAC.2
MSVPAGGIFGVEVARIHMCFAPSTSTIALVQAPSASTSAFSMHLPVAALHSTTAEGGMGLMSSFAKSLQCCSDTASRAEMTSSQRWLAA